MNDAHLHPGDDLEPFLDDLDYLAAELTWLEARVARLAAEREARGAAPPPRLPRRWGGRSGPAASDPGLALTQARAREARLRSDLDGRLAQHRRDPARPPLGLDRLAEAHRLDADARLLVLALAVPALMPRPEEVLGEDVRPGSYGGVAIGELLGLLDLGSLARWMDARRMVHVSLLGTGVTTADPSVGWEAPDGFWGGELRLSCGALATLTGRAELLAEEAAAQARAEAARRAGRNPIVPT